MNPAASPDFTWPFISVILPVYNEESFIEECLLSVIRSGYPEGRYEILVADGRSKDRTCEVVRNLCAEHPFVRLIDNPGKLSATGCNEAVRQADPRSEFIIRLDAHADYPGDFLRGCVQTSLDTKAELVVYANEPHGRGCFQKGVAYAFAHWLGVGNSIYRLGTRSGYVEHGQHGCFVRKVWDELEGYDETQVTNQDAELSYRIIQAGGKVYLNHTLRMHYYPRATVSALTRQYYRYGIGRSRNLMKHRQLPALRQAAPPLWVLLEAALVAGSLFDWRCLLPVLAYTGVLVLFAVLGALRQRSPCILTSALAFWIMHHAWGLGFIRGCLQPRMWDKPTTAS